MNASDKQAAKNKIMFGITNIVRNYSENALLINACDIAKTRYDSITETTGLSTTKNIPPELRLGTEIDVQYTNEELVGRYEQEVVIVVLRNYLIVSISLVDAILEELYEVLLRIFIPDLSDANLEKKIRNAWGNNNLLNFLTDSEGPNLKKPPGVETEFNEAFIRYLELRIIRHTLLHTNGIISERNFKKLEKYLDETPDERKGKALINSPLFDDDRKITLSINNILAIRKYLHVFLMYVYHSIENT